MLYTLDQAFQTRRETCRPDSDRCGTIMCACWKKPTSRKFVPTGGGTDFTCCCHQSSILIVVCLSPTQRKKTFVVVSQTTSPSLQPQHTTQHTQHRTNHTMVSPALATIVATSLARGGSSVLESGAVAVAATSSANHGTTPSSLYDKFHAHTPEPLRFFCSANSGNAVLYVLERVFFALLQDKTLPGMLNQQKGSVSFFLAYLFHVVPQHFFLAFFVYGLHTMSTKEKYWRTLRGTYQT